MSGLDQPILIANCNYHVGQERSFWIAKEQGYFEQEGLKEYVYERGGLIPGKLEFEGLGLVMKERGVDIATAVDIRAAIMHRARGEDVYIVGGWRTALSPKLIGAKNVTSLDQIRGGKVVVRELWGLNHICISAAMRKVGIDPVKDVEWVENTVVSYNNDATVLDLLGSGDVTAVPMSGNFAEDAVNAGHTVLLDLVKLYTDSGDWPPGKVIVATSQVIENRSHELGAFLRGNLRAFWFLSDPKNFEYFNDLERRTRLATHNEDERRLFIMSHKDSGAGHMPLDGLVPRRSLVSMIDDMLQSGMLEQPVEVDDVLKDQAAVEGYNQLVSSGVIPGVKAAH